MTARSGWNEENVMKLRMICEGQPDHTSSRVEQRVVRFLRALLSLHSPSVHLNVVGRKKGSRAYARTRCIRVEVELVVLCLQYAQMQMHFFTIEHSWKGRENVLEEIIALSNARAK